jgi:hypothetical protein
MREDIFTGATKNKRNLLDLGSVDNHIGRRAGVPLEALRHLG